MGVDGIDDWRFFVMKFRRISGEEVGKEVYGSKGQSLLQGLFDIDVALLVQTIVRIFKIH